MTRPPEHNHGAPEVGSGDDAQAAALWRRWFDAVGQPNIDSALHALYDRIDEQVRRDSFVCELSGRCCHFDRFGHRLYVTALEIAWVLTQVDRMSDGGAGPSDPLARIDPHGACTFMRANMCTIHAVRPMGCRIFFCQAGTDDAQHTLYERGLADLRRLHREYDLPYRYLEWRDGLAQARDWRSDHRPR